MTFKEISPIDPWPETCPRAHRLTTRELQSFLSNRNHCELSLWEESFLDTVESMLRHGRELSEGQLKVLDKGLLRQLWSNDPEHWREVYEAAALPAP